MTDNQRIRQLERRLSASEEASDVDIRLRIDTMNDLAWALSDTNATRSQSMAEKAHRLSESNHEDTEPYQLGTAYSLRTLGYLNMRLGNYPLGLTQLFEAQEIFESLDHVEGLPDVFDGITGIYGQIGSFAEALEYAYKQLEAAQKVNDERLIANAHNNVAEIRRSTGDFEHAVEILRNNLETAIKIGYKRIESISHMNLTETYWAVEDYEKALEHGEAALRINQEVGFELFEVYSFMIIGETYRKMGETAPALHNLEQALRLTRRIESRVFEPSILVRMGRTYRSEPRDDLALEYLLQAIEVAQSIDARTELADAHLLLSGLYEGQGNPGQALCHFKKYHSTRESIYDDRTDQRLGVLKVAHDTETSRREAEILQLRTVELGREISERRRAEAALQEAHDRLERRVAERTVELQEAVESLRQEAVQRETAEAETQTRLIVQQSLAAMSTELMQATDFEQAVAHTLAETGELVDANRIFLVRLQSDGAAIHNIHEWCAPGVTPIFHSVEGWTLSGVPWLLEELHERGRFYVVHRSQFPPGVQEEIAHFGGDVGGPYCAVPLYVREEMIGFLGCQGLDPADEELQRHLPVLEVIVGILGSALLRERVLATLEQRVADRTQQLSTFFDLTTLAGGEEDLSDMLTPAVGRILELGSCQASCIHLLDEERATLRLVAQGNLPKGAHQRLQAMAIERAFLQRIDRHDSLLVSTDLAASAALPPPLRLEGFQSYLGVPLRAGGQSHGWVSYYRVSPQGYGLDESSLLVALAQQVGVIAENHRLRQRIEAAVTLEERGRLGRDLHDSVTQSLYSLSLFARSGRDAAEEGDTERLAASLTRLEATALQALREMRLLLYELRPETLDQEGLIRTIERRFDAVERRAGMKATVVYEAEDGPELPQTLERELYYLAMEALNNTLKHARATEVTLSVWLTVSRLELEIADDGCGFDPGKVSGGYGLGDMHERVERLGGQLEVSSAPEAGTRISAQFDLP